MMICTYIYAKDSKPNLDEDFELPTGEMIPLDVTDDMIRMIERFITFQDLTSPIKIPRDPTAPGVTSPIISQNAGVNCMCLFTYIHIVHG